MNQDELIFEQYKLYTEQKENFVDRSFMTNKFYMVLVLVIILLVFITDGLVFANSFSATLIYSIAGIAICTLWWLNMDSYNFLLKIKFSKVIEEIEKQLPVNPYTMEFKAINDFRKNKRMFLFSDMQKAFAILSFLMFLSLFMLEFVPLLINGSSVN